jgi:hypothetical protein
MKVLFRRKSSHGEYGGIHEFNPDTIINAAKVCVCEQKDLDPRKIMLFRDGEVLSSIRRWAEKDFKGKPPQSFNPIQSFCDNNVKEEEVFWLVDNPSGCALPHLYGISKTNATVRFRLSFYAFSLFKL